MAVTPNRRIVLEVDGPEYSAVLQPSFRRSWGGSDIAPSDGWVRRVNPDGSLQFIQGHINTQYVPGDAWVLKPYDQEAFAVVANQTPEFSSAPIQPLDMTLAPFVQFIKSYRPPTDLPGAGGGLFLPYLRSLRRRVPAGTAWDHPGNMLGADQAAYPAPVDPQNPDYLPVDRVMFTNPSYEENMGFAVSFGMQNDAFSGPTFMRIYFGGPTPVNPPGEVGGEFCLVLRGSGKAVLYEKGKNGVTDWRRRFTFLWAEPTTIRGGSHSIQIWPMCRDRILFIHHTSDEPNLIPGLISPPTTLGQVGMAHPTLYRDTVGQTGHEHLRAMTGVGKLRIDKRRDYRLPWHPWILKFPLNGSVRDQAFSCPPLPADTPISLVPEVFGLAGAAVAVQLYNASTGGALSSDGFGHFLAHQSQIAYFAVFNFIAGGLGAPGNQTPVLLSYEVRSDPRTVIRIQDPVEGPVREGSVTGPDIQPGHGSAQVSIRDRKGTFSILRKHDRRYCRLRVDVPLTGPFGDPRGFVILHEGETWQPRAQLRGREALGNKQWWNYQVSMIDLWFRLGKQLTYQFEDYRYDINTYDPYFPEMFAPWVVMAAIRDLLFKAGVPEDEMDTPGWDDPDGLRLWFSPTLTVDDYLLQPGQQIGTFLKRFAFDILGKIVIRDPNVGPRGMWRVIDPPQPASGTGSSTEAAVYPLAKSLANFYVRRPPEIPEITRVVEDAGALDLGEAGEFGYTPGAYIKDESYFVHAQAPEGTYLSVSGVGGLFPDATGAQQGLTQALFNPKAFDLHPDSPTADPDSVSYMDRMEPVFINDKFLIVNPTAANYFTVRYARQVLNGRLWCEFTAPAIFVNDPADDLLNEDGPRRRPLRVYDQVTLVDENGVSHPVMLRNVNFHWTSASIMWMFCQGLFLDAF